MMKISTLILSASALLLFSCSDNEQAKQNSGITGAPVNFSTPSDAQTQPAANAPAGALNPAHGQPNHRCDIAVGAPLNTPAPAGAAPSEPQQAPQLTPQPQPAASAAVNPAHGAPGHNCAIPVGAPLN